MSVNRRLFLSSALVATANATANGRKIKIGFLGGAYSHTEGKLEVLDKSSDFELVGLWDADKALRDSFAKDGIPIVSAEQMLRDSEIEVIAVQSAPPDHARHALMVLEAGKHLHLEKPPALDVPSFRRVIEMARRKNRIVQLGYMWRHHPGFAKIFEMVREGWLGDIYFVQATMNKGLSADRRPEWAVYRGGQMFELNSHLIDQVVRLLGRPNRVTPFLKKHGDFDDNLVDNTVAVFEYSRAMALIVGASLTPNSGRHRSFVVRGTLGTVTMRPIEDPVVEVDLAMAAGPYVEGVQAVSLPPYERYVGDFEELAGAVRGERTLSVTPEEDMMVHETLIEASAM